MEDDNELFSSDTLEDEELNPDDLSVYDDSTVIVDTAEVKKVIGRRRLALVITLVCCFICTVATLAVFSRPNHHSNIDAFFKGVLDFFTKAWNTGPWGFVILGGGVAIPLVSLLVIPRWDVLTRRAPGGSFLYDNVGLCFERRIGFRFIPAFLTILYLVIAAFMRRFDNSASFDPPSYFPFGQHYSGGEWLNLVFVTLTVFSIFLVIAEGVISSGPWGMIIHIPVILAANVCLVAAMTAIMFVVVTLLGFLGQLIMAFIALSALGGMNIKTKTEYRYIEK